MDLSASKVKSTMTIDTPYCAAPLAAYACRPDQSRGRVVPEADAAARDPYQRDRDRILHSTAFRRLKQKTQVFAATEGDHYRTRLTHSLEVAQIARTLARALHANEDLCEGIALAHDLGHPPFAHKGEDVLAALMEPYGGFKHNDQTVRILTHLEHRYAEFEGLNLTFETLEGLIKHNGPALEPGEAIDDLPTTLKGLAKQFDFEPYLHASLEAQIVDISDDTAYFNHDVEDGLRGGYFTIDDLRGLSLYADLIPELERRYPHIEDDILVATMVRAQIGVMVGDVLDTTRKNLVALNPKSVDDIRRGGKQLVRYSDTLFPKVRELRAFLYREFYGHPRMMETLAVRAEKTLTTLFHTYMNDPLKLPEAWRNRFLKNDLSDKNAVARAVMDYIAGMTDTFADAEYARLTQTKVA